MNALQACAGAPHGLGSTRSLPDAPVARPTDETTRHINCTARETAEFCIVPRILEDAVIVEAALKTGAGAVPPSAPRVARSDALKSGLIQNFKINVFYMTSCLRSLSPS